VPFKANAARRHRISKQRHRVTNWAAYDAALRQRGRLTVWFTDEAIRAWRAEPRTTRGGQPWYSPLAILTALTLRVLFRLALRQTKGDRRTLSRGGGHCAAAPGRGAETAPIQRDQHLRSIAERRRLGRQKRSARAQTAARRARSPSPFVP
jgi:hypothetical protein